MHATQGMERDNSVPVSYGIWNGVWFDPSQTLRIGAYPSEPYSLTGTVDEVRVYNAALTSTQIARIALGPSACGDTDHPYPVGDVNTDCYVDLVDLSIIVVNWLECTNPDPPCNYNP